ncbi:MAG: hypothetical protein L6R40_008801, partial [Gallowayella cf. fulva]
AGAPRIRKCPSPPDKRDAHRDSARPEHRGPVSADRRPTGGPSSALGKAGAPRT